MDLSGLKKNLFDSLCDNGGFSTSIYVDRPGPCTCQRQFLEQTWLDPSSAVGAEIHVKILFQERPSAFLGFFQVESAIALEILRTGVVHSSPGNFALIAFHMLTSSGLFYITNAWLLRSYPSVSSAIFNAEHYLIADSQAVQIRGNPSACTCIGTVRCADDSNENDHKAKCVRVGQSVLSTRLVGYSGEGGKMRI
ncbi:hypothetical protein C8R44DRAFT_754631 [Mycena epipterygia]|nr:hypothetical protein C8R44DRAFT_754631 [Mycena epipterygia]